MAPGAVMGGGAGGGGCSARERTCGFVRCWAATQVQKSIKHQYRFQHPLWEVFCVKKGGQRRQKWHLFWCCLGYVFGYGDFLKIDDSIERNAYFCSVRGAQNAAQN